MKRTLTLRREALAPLTGAELVSVAGAAALTQPLYACLQSDAGDLTLDPGACLVSQAPPTVDVTACFPHTALDCLTRGC